MAQGPSLEGRIVLNTQSVEEAIQSVRKLQKTTVNAFGLGGQAAQKFNQQIRAQRAATQKLADEHDKSSNLIAKAANKVAVYEAALKKSNVSEKVKADLFKQSAAELKGYEAAVRAGATSGQALDNINTQLGVSLGHMKRELQQVSAAEQARQKAAQNTQKVTVANTNAISQANMQYERMANSVRQSTMADTQKAAIITRLDAEHKKLVQTLSTVTSSTQRTTQAKNQYAQAMNKANIAVKNSGQKQAAAETKKYATEMRNLSTSVVVALGPLSGIASRITALTTLFNRNAASLAVVLASLTGLSVLFARSSQYAEEAEKQMARIDAQLNILGESAVVTGGQINAMAHEIASATLLSAKEVRDAAGALIQFGGVAREQFDSVVYAAQGMSVVFGGNLRSNIRRLGRAIEDPIDGMSRLEQTGVILSETTKQQVKDLQAQGKQYAATAILLKEMNSLSEAAKGEANSLAGAYDTLSGNLDILYEGLFLSSGAAVAMRDSVQLVADSVKDFSASAEAAAMGQLFVKMAEQAGAAFVFLQENVYAVGAVLAWLGGITIGRLIAAFGALAAKGIANAATAMVALTGAVTRYGGATALATTMTQKFNIALNANLFARVASAIIGVVSALWVYNNAINAIKKSHGTATSQILKEVSTLIRGSRKMSDEQIAGYEQSVAALVSSHNEKVGILEDEEAKFKELGKTAASAMEAAYASARQQRFSGRGTEAQAKQLEDVESLQKAINALAEGGVVTESQMATLRKHANEDQLKILNSYKATIDAIDNQKAAIEGVEKAALKLKEAAESGDAFESLLEPAKQLEAILTSLNEMAPKYLPDESRTKELKEQVAFLEKQGQALLDLQGKVKGISEAYALNRRLVAAIRQELEDISEIEISKEALKLRDGLLQAYNESQKLKEMIGATNEEKTLIELRYEMDSLRDSTKELLGEVSAFEMTRIAEFLPGVSEAAGIDEVTNAYVRWIEAQRLSQIESQKQATAGETVNGFLESQRSSVNALRQDYADLAIAAMESGNMDALPSMEEWFNREKEAMKAASMETATTPFTDLENIDAEYQQRLELLRTKWGEEETEYKVHLDKMKKEAEQQKAFMDFGQKMSQSADLVSMAMETMEAAGKENTVAYKAMAIAQAGINAALAVSQVLADPLLPSWAKIGMAGMIGGMAGMQVAAIASTNYATGGYVQGAGTATSDSIPANLSNGEYVVKADSVRKIGLRNLEMMNQGNIPAYSEGGSVGRVTPMPFPQPTSNGGGVNLVINDQTSGSHAYETQESIDADGQRQIKVLIKDAVKESISKGELDRDMASRFGVRNKGRRV